MQTQSDYYYSLARNKNDWSAGDLKRALDFIWEHPHGTLLEVGCGGSELPQKLPPTMHYVGLDPNADESQVRGVAEHMPFADSHFDIVFSAQTLQMLQDPRRGLIEMMRVTKRGGFVIIIAPNLERPWSRVPSARFYNFFQYARLFLVRVLDSVRRLFGGTPFRILPQNYVEAKGVFEYPDDDMKYITSAYEVARLFRKNNFRIIARKGYLDGGMCFIFKKS